MSQSRATAALVLGSLLLLAGPAGAGSLADLLPTLFGKGGITLAPSPLNQACCPDRHVPHFDVESEAELTILNDSLRGTLGNFPVPSPASSATFQFDPKLGAFTRSTESFGPIYSQRADTIGRGKFSLGFTYSRFTFDKLDGKDLDNGELQVTFFHEPTNELRGQAPPLSFEQDSITAQIFADITSDVFVLSGTYGVLDNLDVSIAIPIIRNEIRLKGVARINRTPGVPPENHQFPGGADTMEARASDESTGLGDILLRGKYNFFRRNELGMAAGLDLRLPTGDEDELRGIDTVRVSPFFIVSAGPFFGVAPHANVGFHIGDDDKLENEFFYAVGFDWAIVKPVTLAFDILGRHILDNQRIKAGSSPGSREISDSNLVDASIGFKVNPWRNVLLLFNVLVPLNDTGLRDNVTPLFGIEVFF